MITLSTNPSAPFPAFFSADSGCKSPVVLSTPASCAAVIRHHGEMGLRSGILIANPVPAEFAAEGKRMEEATQRALREMKEKGIQGSEVTPFLLLRIAELTQGESLASNVALILHNVRTAALIATQLQQMDTTSPALPPSAFSSSSSSSSSPSSVSSPSSSSPPPLTVVVCGAVNLDLIGRPAPGVPFLLGTSSPGTIERHLGGVGRNIAEALGRLGHSPLLIAPVGADDTADQIVRQCGQVGIRSEGFVRLPGMSSSIYMAVLDEHNDRQTLLPGTHTADEREGRLSTTTD